MGAWISPSLLKELKRSRKFNASPLQLQASSQYCSELSFTFPLFVSAGGATRNVCRFGGVWRLLYESKYSVIFVVADIDKFAAFSHLILFK